MDIERLTETLRSLQKCPRCQGKGEVVRRVSYERMDDGGAIPIAKFETCGICHGKGIIEID